MIDLTHGLQGGCSCPNGHTECRHMFARKATARDYAETCVRYTTAGDRRCRAMLSQLGRRSVQGLRVEHNLRVV